MLINFLVLKTGLLFEMWFYINCTKKWENHSLKTLVTNQTSIVKQTKEKFFTWFLMACKCISQKELKEYKQMVFTNKNLLSRKTQKYISRSGVVSSYSTSRRFEKKQLEEYSQGLNTLNKNSVIWFDNYSKFYKTNQISLDKSGFEICNWTVFGKISTTSEILKKDVDVVVENKPITERTDVRTLLRTQADVLNIYDIVCITRVFGICSVPLRTTERDKEHLFCLDNYFPQRILEENTSSDSGLFNCFKYLYDTKDKETICPVVVDIKIFWRYYLWLYNKDNDLYIKNDFCVLLGTWHTYKELNLLTWKFGLRILFGPVYHAIYPTSKIFFKPKLGHLETFFTWITIAFTKEDLREKLERSIEDSEGQQKIILTNFKIFERKSYRERYFFIYWFKCFVF